MRRFIEKKQEGSVSTVFLGRPETYNAFDLQMISELAEVLTQLAINESVRGVILTGQGKAFCAGGDLKWAVEFSEKAGSSFHTLASQLHLAIVEIRRMKKPVIAAINGIAAGAGFSLALACDFRIMEQSSMLRQAYTSNGLCIDGGGTFTLPRIVGLARALEIAAFDDPISSSQAMAWGLVTKVVDDGTVLKEAGNMLSKLTKKNQHIHSVGQKNYLQIRLIMPLNRTWNWKEKGLLIVQIILTAKKAYRHLLKNANHYLNNKKLEE